jgi:hypothetical protein
MTESYPPRHIAGFVSPVCLVLLLLASLLVAQFSDSAVLQQRHVSLLSQQLAAERVARVMLHRAPDAESFACQITATTRCWPGDEVLLPGTELRAECRPLAEALWLCLASVDGRQAHGVRAVLHAVLPEPEL